MGKKPWTTKKQYTWLNELMPKFIRAQEDKTTGKFQEDTFRGWYERFPDPALTQNEIEAANGSVERALATQRKNTEKVRVR
jgi:hypothetical protein